MDFILFHKSFCILIIGNMSGRKIGYFSDEPFRRTRRRIKSKRIKTKRSRRKTPTGRTARTRTLKVMSSKNSRNNPR